MTQKSSDNRQVRRRSGGMKRGTLLLILFAGIVVFVAGHEAAVRYFPDKVCIACHEMKDPIKRWREAGVAEHHRNCGGCHFDAGLAGQWQMNVSAVKFLIEHFRRDPDKPLEPPPEPLFVDPAREPAYYSLVPNHRCFQCKNAKNHKPIEQTSVHAKLMRFSNTQPCKDCHNHEMRNGQKFYERVLPEKEKVDASM